MSTNASDTGKGKNRRGLYVIVGLITAGLLAGGTFYVVTRNDESTDDAQVDAHVVMVSARVAGTVGAVRFVDNQTVSKGQLLVEIEPADYQVLVDAAKANLDGAQAALQVAQAKLEAARIHSKAYLSQSTAAESRSKSGIGASQAAIHQAEAAVAAAKARLDDAQANAKRARSLSAEGAMPQQQLDAAETALATAQANYAQAEASLAQMQSAVEQAQAGLEEAEGRVVDAKTGTDEVAAAEASVASAQAQVDGAKAKLDQAQLDLSYTKVAAPADGVIAKRTVEPGQTVNLGQPLFSIVPLHDVWVDANFKETQIGRMKPGQAAEVVIDALPGRAFHGRVESLSPATGARFSLLPPDNATGNFVKVVQRLPVRIRLDDSANAELLPGLSAEVTVDVGSPPADLTPRPAGGAASASARAGLAP